ncbi:FprA family A-type flavoprotein [candidate division WOR-3 bacterium]|nr:FprA family A-type flavoprotein [candidate division WOR-3 bacterium]
MAVQNIKPGVYCVGAIDWDRRLFDELIPLPDGTTYNAYIVQGSEKTALIDTVDPTKEQEFFNNLTALDIARIDYVITNHAEQDHSGVIPRVLERYPEAMVVTNEKCKTFTMEHLPVPGGRFKVVKDGDTLPLGNKTLSFIIAPWVHWPETMLTYLKEDRILFPCDLFGSHLASSDILSVDEGHVYRAAKRYYAEIMMPFRTMIKKHIATLQKYEIAMIAPSHGPIHDNPGFIINAYREWISDDVKNEVLLPYVSMHGSVHRMAGYFTEELMKRNIKVLPFNLTNTDIGELAMALVDAATIVIGSPTVLTGPHPAAVYAAYLTNALRPKTRFASIIGSYGWAGKMPETLQSMLGNLKVEVLDPVIARGDPKPNDFKKLQRLAEDILKKHQESKITT